MLLSSEYQSENMINSAEFLLEDEFLWCRIIKRLYSNGLCSSGMIFSGPKGSGKHSAASLALKYVTKTAEGQCGYIYISSDDLDFDEDIIKTDIEYRASLKDDEYPFDIAELFLDKLITAVREKIGDSKKNRIMILIDDEDEAKNNIMKKLYKSAAFDIIQFSTDPELPQLFVFIVTNDEMSIPHCIRSQLRLLKTDMPDSSEREKLIVNKSDNSDITALLKEETAGMNISDIRDMLDAAFAANVLSENNSQNTNIIKRMTESMKYRPVKETAVPAAAGGIDAAAMMSMMEAMGDKISQGIAANTPNTLDLNSMSNDLKNSDDSYMEKPDSMQIKEDAENQTWGDLLSSALNMDISKITEKTNNVQKG